jgi:hypothetical protein
MEFTIMEQTPESQEPASTTNINKTTVFISIIASLMASIIFYIFLQPILAFINESVARFISIFYQGFVDKSYEQAKGSITDSILLLIFTVGNGVFSGILVGILVARITLQLLGRQRARRLARIRLVSVVFYIAVVAVVFTIPLGTFAAASFANAIQAHSTFDNRLMALTPVISDQERKNLIGQWAFMGSKSDFFAIDHNMETLANKYHVKLPERFSGLL